MNRKAGEIGTTDVKPVASVGSRAESSSVEHREGHGGSASDTSQEVATLTPEMLDKMDHMDCRPISSGNAIPIPARIQRMIDDKKAVEAEESAAGQPLRPKA